MIKLFNKWSCEVLRSVIITFNRANGEMKNEASEEESDEENEEGDYTVYECPGLAPVSTNRVLR